MDENSISSYREAMDLLDELEDYKDSEKLYLRAEYMCNGNYKEIVKMDNLKEFVIPEGTTKIIDEAFYGEKKWAWSGSIYYDCRSLISITIPNSVTEIGEKAFKGCENLTSITIPDSVTSIGSFAFSNCSSLASVTMPDSVTTIGVGTFGDCSSLTSIKIPDGVTTIGSYAFYQCSSLTSVTIGNGETLIDKFAFKACCSLTSATFKNPNGWRRPDWSSGGSISSSDLSDPAIAALRLTSIPLGRESY